MKRTTLVALVAALGVSAASAFSFISVTATNGAGAIAVVDGEVVFSETTGDAVVTNDPEAAPAREARPRRERRVRRERPARRERRQRRVSRTSFDDFFARF